MRRKLNDGVGTVVFAKAVFAVASNPHVIKLVDGAFDKFGFVGEDSGLEVAASVAFHADTGAGEVGAADVGGLEVEDHELEMHAGAQHAFEPVDEDGVAVEVFAEVGAGVFGVDEAHGYAPADELGDDSEQWSALAFVHDVEVFDVGRADPKVFLDGGQARQHLTVVVGITDVGGHRSYLGKKNTTPVSRESVFYSFIRENPVLSLTRWANSFKLASIDSSEKNSSVAYLLANSLFPSS